MEHPRARGENLTHDLLKHCINGTSPRTRGKRRGWGTQIHRHRNIPAHAGKTFFHTVRDEHIGEHPRARGENDDVGRMNARLEGTSPRTRGKHGAQSVIKLKERNIPAHAGKTPPFGRNPGQKPEHPRARGENEWGGSRFFVPFGTSPRTRGKLEYAHGLVTHSRNIPAHAGKTSSMTWMNCSAPEHPRARGENTPQSILTSKHGGTSPRTRGKLKPAWDALGAGRNIPAHAGKTRRLRILTLIPREHPRARGENSDALRAASCCSGTSPRTRGKLQDRGGQAPDPRNIPAHAGKTAYSRAHAAHEQGTSPRTRGKPTNQAGRLVF